jgi:periplasmic protein CpxP/Spy
MKRYLKVSLAVSLVVLLLVSAVAVANAQNAKRLQQNRRQAAALKGMSRAGLLLGGLDLTDQQKEQVKGILATHKTEIKTAVQENVKARKGLREALASGADQTVLRAAYDQVSGAGWNTLRLRSQIGSEVKQVLTPEQQERLQKRLQNINKLGMQLLQNRRIKKLGF